MTDAPVIDINGRTEPVGYHQIHPDVSINFQCNRWAQWIGPESLDEIGQLARRTDDYPDWIDGFLDMAVTARQQGRDLAGAYYDRAAEFFMPRTDPRKTATRHRFIDAMQGMYATTPEVVAFDSGFLPAYDLRPTRQEGDPIVVFGGFDSYIEEFFPMLFALVNAGRRVVVFDGPGQGGALEDHGLAMISDWERPVTAVLDHFTLTEVTAVGISLGGALVIRAAAYEPRIKRAVAFDICYDEFTAALRQFGGPTASLIRYALDWAPPQLINAAARAVMACKPVVNWALPQGLHVTGTSTPYEFLRTTRDVSTAGYSPQVRSDVLLLAGADDHYMPLPMLWRQATTLTRARSITTRIFTADEDASNHCQIGNIGLAARVINDWIRQSENEQYIVS